VEGMNDRNNNDNCLFSKITRSSLCCCKEEDYYCYLNNCLSVFSYCYCCLIQKFHVTIPRKHIDKVRNLKGKQVKVTIEDEL